MLEASLNEINGNELRLSVDPECSLVIQHLIKRMGDFEKRVFLDSLLGNLSKLMINRFGSHVIQTLLHCSKGTIMRESRGEINSNIDNNDSNEDVGELKTMMTYIEEVVKEILPDVSNLLTDTFATHPLRQLLQLLSSSNSNIIDRSKKSMNWLNKHEKSDLDYESYNKDPDELNYKSPKVFKNCFKDIRISIFNSFTDANEVRQFGISNIGAPLLQLLLRYEKESNLSDGNESFLDCWLDGLVMTVNTEKEAKSSNHLITTLLDQTASHTTEVALECSNSKVFKTFWELYFKGKNLQRCLKHPIGNFVISKALNRLAYDLELNEKWVTEQLNEVINVLKDVGKKLIKTNRLNPLLAAVDIGVNRKLLKDEILNVIVHSFGLSVNSNAQREHLIMCMLEMKRWKTYRRFHDELFKNTEGDNDESDDNDNDNEGINKGKKKENLDELYTFNGALLIQKIFKLGQPLNNILTSSLLKLDIGNIIKICASSYGSRIIDSLIEAREVSNSDKREIRKKLIGSYHRLADLRVGSRVAEKIYEYSDSYFREKIVESLLQHEDFLAGSPYGKYLSRKVDLSLYRRRKYEWKEKVSEEVREFTRKINENNNNNNGNDEVVKKNNKRVFNGMIAHDPLPEGESEGKTEKKRKNDNEEPKSRAEKRAEKRQRRYNN